MQISCKNTGEVKIARHEIVNGMNRLATRTGGLRDRSDQRSPSTKLAMAFMYSESPTMKMLL
jgi:hypothetical protein